MLSSWNSSSFNGSFSVLKFPTGKDFFLLFNAHFSLSNIFYQVPEPETVACHMYRMAVLTMTIEDSSLDLSRCLRMALIHDLGEAIVGDITPRCGVPSDVKHRMEEKATFSLNLFKFKRLNFL